jgi:hypothetical protein
MEYLIFKTLALAITSSIMIWQIMKLHNRFLTKNEYNPKELDNGDFAVKKPEDKYMAGIDAPIEIDPKFKEED